MSVSLKELRAIVSPCVWETPVSRNIPPMNTVIPGIYLAVVPSLNDALALQHRQLSLQLITQRFVFVRI